MSNGMQKQFTHDDLVKIAERWLLGSKGCGFAFAELMTQSNTGEIPDALGWKGNKSILVECKTSRSDFLADKKKPFRAMPELGIGAYRYYLCPEGVITPDDLPAKWGLVWVSNRGVAKQKVGPKGKFGWENTVFYHPTRNTRNEHQMLYSALRRIHLRGAMGLIYENNF